MARRSVEHELEPDLASTGVETDLTSTEVATAASTEMEPDLVSCSGETIGVEKMFSSEMIDVETSSNCSDEIDPRRRRRSSNVVASMLPEHVISMGYQNC